MYVDKENLCEIYIFIQIRNFLIGQDDNNLQIVKKSQIVLASNKHLAAKIILGTTRQQLF